MTPEQRLNELRKALAADERLRLLVVDCAEHYVNTALRRNFGTLDVTAMVRQVGFAEGAEKFVKEITKAPTTAQDRPAAPLSKE